MTNTSQPYIAGVAALYLSAHGGRAALGVERVNAFAASLTSAGTPVYWNDGKTSVQSLPTSYLLGLRI